MCVNIFVVNIYIGCGVGVVIIVLVFIIYWEIGVVCCFRIKGFVVWVFWCWVWEGFVVYV